MKWNTILCITGLAFMMVQCEDGPEEKSWTLVWQDEFDGAEGESPDPSKWGFDIGTDWGNQQLEFDTDRPENASLDGEGNLRIVSRRESFGGRAFTSARMTTQGKFSQTYGRFEARMQMPLGQGLWPAFWLLGENIDEVSWPQCGEIDIMEYRGQEPQIVHGSLHGPGNFAGQALTQSFTLPNDRFDVGFHLFAVEWDENGISYFVDDRLYYQIKPEDTGEWVFNAPFFIIVNVAVGGNYVGPPNESTAFPQTMLVDYVRVYREE